MSVGVHTNIVVMLALAVPLDAAIAGEPTFLVCQEREMSKPVKIHRDGKSAPRRFKITLGAKSERGQEVRVEELGVPKNLMCRMLSGLATEAEIVAHCGPASNSLVPGTRTLKIDRLTGEYSDEHGMLDATGKLIEGVTHTTLVGACRAVKPLY